MKGTKRAFGIVLAIAAVLIASGTLVSAARAASFTEIPPATTTSGVGPFTWSFHPDAAAESAYSWLAYKLSTEPYWHRCSQTDVVTIENLPIGTYFIEISDDFNLYNWSARGLGNSGFTQPCHESPPSPSTFATRVSSFTVIAPPVLPVVTTPPPTAPPATATPAATATPPTTTSAEPSAPACKKVAAERTRLVVAIRGAHRRLKHSKTQAQRRAWGKLLAADRASLRALVCP
jgi:hypothetical protein